ncbi:unnamed protein product, partial [Discosporangium mesarthrocarpum]
MFPGAAELQNPPGVGFLEDDANRRARSQRRFQTGLLICLLLILLDARSSNRDSQGGAASGAAKRKSNQALTKMADDIRRDLEKLPHERMFPPNATGYYKGDWRRVEHAVMVTPVSLEAGIEPSAPGGAQA